jgi:lysozyme
MDVETLRKQLNRDEGRRNKPYRCTAGKLTLGVGRNIEDVGLSEDEIDYLLSNDIERVEKDLQTFAWWPKLDPVRQVALANMRFQLGPNRFREFKKMILAVAKGDFERAAKEALDSKWAKQTPKRAARVAYQIRTGKL